MEHYLQPIMEYLRHHPGLGLLFTFIIALIESLPVLGTLVPGSITMTAVGVLVGSGVMPISLTLFAAIIGAFIGDCLGFWLGSTYHEEIRNIWPFNKITKWLDYGERFFAKHGGKSIIIGRFIGPTRAAMPLIAGMLRLSWNKFLLAGFIASILWSLVYMVPGILLGAVALEFPRQELSKVFLFGIAAIVAAWLIFWLVQYFFKTLRRSINHSMSTWWASLKHHRSANFFVKMIRNQQNTYDFHQLTLVLMIVLLIVLFLIVWISMLTHAPLSSLNPPLFNLLQSFRAPLNRFWVVFTLLGDPTNILISSIIIAIGLFLYKQNRAATHLLILIIVATIFTAGLKHLYYSPRPTGTALYDPSSSFPSGHTLMSTTLFGFLAFLSSRLVNKNLRHWCYFLFYLIILLIGLSRLFLGQHWLTDVLGGWLMGSILFLLTILSYQRLPQTTSLFTLSKTRWLLILVIGVLVPWLANCVLHFHKTVQETRVVWPKVKLNLGDWWQNPTAEIPLYRLDRFGRATRPFNIQWAGNLDEIKQFLAAEGWEPLDLPSHVEGALQRFTSYDPARNRPILAELYHLHPPALIFIKHLVHSPDIMELQLWDSGIKFSDSSIPLWVGIMVYHTPPEKLLRFPRNYMRLQSGKVLLDSINIQTFEIKSAYVDPNNQPARIKDMNWDGVIFVLKPRI